MNDRTVYVISDLHLDGEPGANGWQHKNVSPGRVREDFARYLHGDGARMATPPHVRKIDLMATVITSEDNRGYILGIEAQRLL
jgi:hypothetical protein